jgi:NADH-quinone oxidoreductase subunit A
MMAEDFHPVSMAAQAGAQPELTPAGVSLYRELGIREPTLPPAGESPAATVEEAEQGIRAQARRLALISMADIAVFFAVLMVGFFYVWKRGDLDWVRALSKEKAAAGERDPPYRVHEKEPALAS